MAFPRKTSVISFATSAGVVLAVLIVWFAVTPNLIPELVFPSPSSVAQAIRSLGWMGLAAHASATFGRVALGWIVGVPLGIAMGFAIASNAALRAVAHPLVEAVRPLPPVALIPFFIIWFGLGLAGQVVLIALGCFMVLTVNTIAAVSTVPEVFVRAALSLGTPRRAMFQFILFPAILPQLIGGFRIAAALAFGLGVAAEFMGAQSGLGFLMMVARRTLNTNTILVGVVIIGAESFLFDWLIRVVGGYAIRWTEAPLEAFER